MKATAVCFLMLLGFLGLYYFGIFDFFASRYALWMAVFLIFVVFLAGLKILGNPIKAFKEKKKK